MNHLDTPFFDLSRREYLAMPPMPLDQRKKDAVEMLMNQCAHMYRTFRNHDFPPIFKQTLIEGVLDLLKLLDEVDDTHKFVTIEMRVSEFLLSWRAYFNHPFPIHFPENHPCRSRG
ncbi:unnamed protein product [Caenorhabditis angaria]|uniref:Uncharacterized protein n=1 Tax=Caenorhabditis angaria TaxID=860376 RepID=A0A9P1J1M1_9PELO|nr:unnamed protein product [Caenorhabditis angaria]